MRLPTLSPRIATAQHRRVPLAPKQVEPYYGSVEHKAWRTAVIRRARGRCEWPGCGATGRLYADHVVELRDGGSRTDPANGRALCATHHGLKTAAAKRARR